VTFAVADFRDLSALGGRFDVVISCDNAIPHLLDPADIPKALTQMRSKLRPGGLLVITMRDFDRALVERPPIAPPVIAPGPPRRVLVRLHDWDGDQSCYTVRFLVLSESSRGWDVVERVTRYRAITRDELTAAATVAGFADVAWPSGETVVPGQRVMTAINAENARA
jgi:glycine/sarcosine N-methyltransferase